MYRIQMVWWWTWKHTSDDGMHAKQVAAVNMPSSDLKSTYWAVVNSSLIGDEVLHLMPTELYFSKNVTELTISYRTRGILIDVATILQDILKQQASETMPRPEMSTDLWSLYRTSREYQFWNNRSLQSETLGVFWGNACTCNCFVQCGALLNPVH